jgi:nucleoside-diphosphate-sugar epimerase
MATPEEPSRPDGRSRPTVNLGNPGEFTFLELAEKVIHLTGLRSRIIFQPLPQDVAEKRIETERFMAYHI